MITNLLTAIAITLGIGTNLNNFYVEKNTPKPEIKRANENVQDYTLNINYQNYAIQDIAYSGRYYTNVANARNKFTGSNNALIVNANYYYNLLYSINNNTKYGWFKNSKNNTINQYLTKQMMVYQITPYNINVNTEQHIHLGYVLTIPEAAYQEGYVLGEKTINVKTYITFNDWSQYLDNNNYAQDNFIKNVEDELTSSENGYSYQTKEQNITIARNTNWGNVDTEIDYTQNNTMYVIQIITPMVSYLVEEELPDLVYENTQDVLRAEIPSSPYNTAPITLSISGTMIIPNGVYEVIDLPGIMFYVLTMPFTFISVAFNLTLFPGTQYQVNIANLFLALFAVMVLIFVMKIVVKLNSGS